MAQLLLIAEKTHNPGVNAVGDIVAIVDDDHAFTAHEQDIFAVVSVPNLTAQEFKSALKSPNIQTVMDSEGTQHTMWRNSESDPWQKLEKDVKYTWATAGITADEQALFLSPSVAKENKIAMLQQFGNNVSYQPENRETTITVSITEQRAQ